MVGPLDNALWLGEFILELAGAVLVFTNLRQIKILWSYLAFRAGSDLFTFALACGWGYGHYGWANYVQRLVGYVMLAVLGVRVIGTAFNVNQAKVRNYAIAAAVVMAGLIAVLHSGPWTVGTLFKIGFRVDMALQGVIAGALLLRDLEIIVMPMEKHWSRISSAVMIAIFTHALCTELQMRGFIGITAESRLMAVGQLLALGTWIMAAWNKPEEFEMFRLGSIGSPKAEPLIFDEPMNGTMN